jgi:hypothetical protein
MTWPDTGSKLLKAYDTYVDQGRLAKLVSRFEVDVKVKFNVYQTEEKEVFYRNPAFISAFDAT